MGGKGEVGVGWVGRGGGGVRNEKENLPMSEEHEKCSKCSMSEARDFG